MLALTDLERKTDEEILKLGKKIEAGVLLDEDVEGLRAALVPWTQQLQQVKQTADYYRGNKVKVAALTKELDQMDELMKSIQAVDEEYKDADAEQTKAKLVELQTRIATLNESVGPDDLVTAKGMGKMIKKLQKEQKQLLSERAAKLKDLNLEQDEKYRNEIDDLRTQIREK